MPRTKKSVPVKTEEVPTPVVEGVKETYTLDEIKAMNVKGKQFVAERREAVIRRGVRERFMNSVKHGSPSHYEIYGMEADGEIMIDELRKVCPSLRVECAKYDHLWCIGIKIITEEYK